jgi:hypothetical protein
MALRKEDLDNNNDRQRGHPAKRSRITIDITPELRRRIKQAALQLDLSVSEYAGRILEEAVPEEKSMTQREHPHITYEAIERLKKLSQQIIQDRGGKPFEDSTEMLRQQREERTRQLMGEL